MAKAEERFVIDTAVRDFHSYREIWNPATGETNYVSINLEIFTMPMLLLLLFVSFHLRANKVNVAVCYSCARSSHDIILVLFFSQQSIFCQLQQCDL